MPGIEYLPDEPGRADDEELLAGPHHTIPRWAIVLGVALLGVAAVVVTVTRQHSPSPRVPIAATRSAAPPSLPPVPDNRVGAPLAVGRGRPALDVAIAGVTTWLLQARELHSFTETGRVADVAIAGAPLTSDPHGVAKLVLDVPSGVVWVVVIGADPARILEYDMERLRLVREVSVGVGVVGGAAALGGHLYLTSGPRILDVAPGKARPVVIGEVSSPLGPIVADPARNRLLVADFGQPIHVWPVRPHVPAHVVGRPATINLTSASLAVADGAIWLAGFGTGSGVLMRLDPRTLRPTVQSPLDPVLEPAAELAGSGVVVIWVRSDGGATLRCVDAATGEGLQSWSIDGPVASGGASALVATPSGAVPLDLAGCSG
jgi:hypothetical protein